MSQKIFSCVLTQLWSAADTGISRKLSLILMQGDGRVSAIRSPSRPSALRQAILRHGVHLFARKSPSPIPSERLVNLDSVHSEAACDQHLHTHFGYIVYNPYSISRCDQQFFIFYGCVKRKILKHQFKRFIWPEEVLR